MEYWVLFLLMTAYGLWMVFPVAPRKFWLRWVYLWLAAAIPTLVSFVRLEAPNIYVGLIGLLLISFAVVVIRSAWRRFFDYLAGGYP